VSGTVEVAQLLFMLVVVLLLAKSASVVFNKFGVPGLIGEIFIGILIANLVIGDWSLLEALGLGGGNNPTENQYILDVLGELGIIFLLFSVGLETRVRELISVGRAAFMVAILGVVIPFGMAYAFMMFQDGNSTHAMFLGAALVATSVGITARVIKDMKLTDTKEAKIIIGAAVIDDVMGMVILAIVVGMATSGSADIMHALTITISAVVFVFATMLFCLKGVPKINEYMKNRLRSQKAQSCDADVQGQAWKAAMMIITCLAFAVISQWIGLAAIIGAFLAGMIFADNIEEWDMKERIDILNIFFVSFFFVNVGLKVDLSSITGEILLLAAVVIIIAFASKYIGCFLGAKFGDKSLDKSSANIIGIGMVPRGEVGIIVASIGLAEYAITGELYTIVVMMSVITTIVAPIFLCRACRKKYCGCQEQNT